MRITRPEKGKFWKLITEPLTLLFLALVGVLLAIVTIVLVSMPA